MQHKGDDWRAESLHRTWCNFSFGEFRSFPFYVYRQCVLVATVEAKTKLTEAEDAEMDDVVWDGGCLGASLGGTVTSTDRRAFRSSHQKVVRRK